MAVACEEPRVSEGEHLAELAVVELLDAWNLVGILLVGGDLACHVAFPEDEVRDDGERREGEVRA